jgi:hypothetical protein
MADAQRRIYLPCAPLWAFFTLPRGRLLKVHAEPCMFAPGYLQSLKPRWPSDAAIAAATTTEKQA